MESKIKTLIWQTMKEKKVSLRTLAVNTGICLSALSEYINTETKPIRFGNLLKILDTLDLTSTVFKDISNPVKVIKEKQLQEKLKEVEKLKQELGEL